MIEVQNTKVVELGVGTGIVGIDLLRRGVDHYVGIDIDDRILPVALRNITHAVPGQTSRFTLLTSDLLVNLGENHSFDIVCGCLPQVSKPPTITLGFADSFARYFDSQKYQSDLNVYGLGLNESLGHEFFFYEDELCEKRITVAEAEQRRLQGRDSWHKIYVVKGTIAS